MSDENAEPIATSESAKKISAIGKETVHRICSGQVVVDLAVAIKELLENSIDSGATAIEVKLTDYGKTRISVSDNGSGVLERDFDGLALKHHTSKIREFDDLADVATFGFRGEALSSLSALSDLVVTTRHASVERAFELTYDKNGILSKKEYCARSPGTTVVIKNIFKNLPVRAREFEKNLKKEFAKMVQILYGYCLVSTGIGISCTNVSDGRGDTRLIVATTADASVRDNIGTLFGGKSLLGLTSVELQQPDETTLEEYGLSTTSEIDFSWEFYVSDCERTAGRSAPDRQFFYVNGRPCRMTKIAKLVNNIYRGYNNKQYPFIYLNLASNRRCADVNVTPDKRTILLVREKLILCVIKYSLVKKWDQTRGRFAIKTPAELDRGLKRGASNCKNESPDPPTKKFLHSKTNARLPSPEEYGTMNSDEENGKDEPIEKLKDREFEISLESVKRRLSRRNTISAHSGEEQTMRIKYRIRIEESSNAEAEKELRRELTTESFEKMDVVGQFNLGFIVARLGGDLFMIDQHASDEKFRFEKLNDETILKTQKLIVPQLLELPALDESVLIEHRRVFENNGFTFDINENDNPGRRVYLTGMPTSGDWQFGREDVEELIFLMREGGANINEEEVSAIPRPSRVRRMFASRACRGAIMIGTALDNSEMKRLVSRMGKMKNPWNCPHGRPTMRHLLSLTLLKR